MSVDTTVTLRECCGCGAKLVYRGNHPDEVGRHFRVNHQHVEPPAPPTLPEVWREDDRIRREDSTGYGDKVSDHQIIAHMAETYATDPEHFLFGMAVLRLRATEREARS